MSDKIQMLLKQYFKVGATEDADMDLVRVEIDSFESALEEASQLLQAYEDLYEDDDEDDEDDDEDKN